MAYTFDLKWYVSFLDLRLREAGVCWSLEGLFSGHFFAAAVFESEYFFSGLQGKLLFVSSGVGLATLNLSVLQSPSPESAELVE